MCEFYIPFDHALIGSKQACYEDKVKKIIRN